jgi:cytochrome c oxidase subunit 1
MATITHPQPQTLPVIFRRPRATEGFWGWFNTIDHKKIGVLYGVTAFVFFLLGGIEALLVRVQLAAPNLGVLSAEQYNQMFTMHGTTMVFLVIMPMGAMFFNLMTPLMIGARDVAFPRLNALSYWLFLCGGIFINSGWLIGQSPNQGWFGYANLTERAYTPGYGVDFWLLGLQILGIASLMAAFNFIVTILNMRAPGLTLTRLPVFIWMTLVVQFLLITAMPVISVALFEIGFDRFFGANFFNVEKGGDPVLWQHLFWLFGHPEVYILILPAMGIVSEVLPVFSRKPLFGYTFVVFSGIAIGFMGWSVWVHHMFTVGLGPVANAAFGISTMLIAVPTGVKIFNWLGTMAGCQLSFLTPLIFSLGFIALFIIGGLSGVTHAIVPADTQQQDTYYIVAHFHYVLFGGALFGIFSGVYYWFPKFTGRLLNEGIGHWHFWLMFIGMNLTFGPMHVVGLNGMPRRIYTYPEDMGWDFWNAVETIGAFMIALSILVFMYNVYITMKKPKTAGPDPWDARTLEWTIPSPPPEYNFETIPTVRARDPFWHDKYVDPHATDPHLATAGRGAAEQPALATPPGEAEHDGHAGDGHMEGRHNGHADGHAGHGGHGIHMPSPSYFPFVTALGMVTAAYGLILTRRPTFILDLGEGYWWYAVCALGLAIMCMGVYGWALEPVTDEEHVPDAMSPVH